MFSFQIRAICFSPIQNSLLMFLYANSVRIQQAMELSTNLHNALENNNKMINIKLLFLRGLAEHFFRNDWVQLTRGLFIVIDY